jgi:hypothetical protein
MRMLAVVLLPALLGCRTDTPEPPPMKAILHLGDGSESLIDGALAAMREAGVAAEFRAMEELAPEERPAFVADTKGGWLLFVRVDQEELAKKVQEEWWAELTRKAEEIPPPPEPVVLGAAKDLPPDRVDAIRAELARRVEIDQAVRRDSSRHGEMPKVDADNTAYLRKLVTEVGWIDARRFGREAAGAAFLIVQHSGDLPLMAAALPVIEMEVEAGHLAGQEFALLYDRLRLMRGGKQRYGTQVVVRPNGDQVVERLEDPDHVDERRRKVGLGPLADYLELFGDVKIER